MMTLLDEYNVMGFRVMETTTLQKCKVQISISIHKDHNSRAIGLDPKLEPIRTDQP